MLDLDLIVKAYDIRGTYPEQIDAATCHGLGVGFARFIQAAEPQTTSVVIARDMRPSGPELVGAFGDGIRSQGLDVIDIGMGSTDMIYFASGSLDVPGAMFTASHNPAGYNGIKLCRSGAAPIGEDSGLADIKATALASAAGDVPDADVEGTLSSATCSMRSPITSAPLWMLLHSDRSRSLPTPQMAWGVSLFPRSSRRCPSTSR